MEIRKGNKTALLFGATGLVGHSVLEFLLLHGAYQRVISFGRRTLEVEHDKLQHHVVDLEHPESYWDFMQGDDVFLCLGTTMAKAGSKEAFYKVDFTYSYYAANIAQRNGANQLLLVSSVGADTGSLLYYSRVKGELEEAVKKLPYWAIHLFRPSVLLGNRVENRWGKEAAGKIGRVLDRLSGGLLMKYKPIEADVVAKAMVSAAQRFEPGIHVYPSHDLQKLSDAIALTR